MGLRGLILWRLLMNRQGVIVAYYTAKHKSGTGKNLSYRHYFRAAIAGQSNVFAAVGTNSGKRGLYFAAPVYDKPATSSEIVGVVVIKRKPLFLDKILQQWPDPAVLLSPSGVVYASNRPSLLYRASGKLDEAYIAKIRSIKRFGKIFLQQDPQPLHWQLQKGEAEWQGIHHLLRTDKVNFNDPLGSWELVLLQDTTGWFPVRQRWIVAVFTSLILLLLGMVIFGHFRSRYQRMLADEKILSLSQAIEQSPAAVAILDHHYRVEYTNRHFLDLEKTTLSQSMGKPFNEICELNLEQQEADQVWKQLAEGKAWKGEVEKTLADGLSRWEMVSLFPIRIADGSIHHYVITKEDISAQKTLQAELVEARDIAESASEARSRFLANMSHEIRTPLNGIIGFTDLALKEAHTTQLKDFLGKVKTSADSLLHLINDILDFSKIEAGKLDIEHIEFQLHSVLDDVGALFSDLAARRGLELLVQCDPQIKAGLRGDPLRLRQILVNLLSNAIKFTASGRVSVIVRLAERKETSQCLRFEVIDEGIGITEEQQQRLFAAFSQADDSTTRRFGGTGLGLSICKQLVELMHGQIGVNSQPGAGSIFWFELPLDVLPQEKQISWVLSEDATAACVLVHESDAMRQTLLSELLATLGLQYVHFVAKPAEMAGLLAQCRQQKKLLIIGRSHELDALLPAISEIRKLLNPDQSVKFLLLQHYAEQNKSDVRYRQADICVYEPLLISALHQSLMQLFGLADEQTEAVTTEEWGDYSSSSVLLAEDNPINQALALNLLKSLSIQADVVENGRLAVEAVEQKHYDLVLMDMQMPELDGYQASREIRRFKLPIEPVIIAMTAHALQGDRQKCLDAGMNDYLSKPIDGQQFNAMLAKWLKPAKISTHSVESNNNGVQFPTILPGFDLAQARERCVDDAGLFCRLVSEFSISGLENTQRLLQALKQDERQQSLALAHEIKGVAGNLAATQLYALASEMETSLRSGHSQQGLLPLAQQMQSEMERIVESVEQFIDCDADLESMDDASLVFPLAPALLVDFAARLASACDEGDITALESLIAELPQDSALYRKLRELLMRFDFSSITGVGRSLLAS
ncbi:MAG: response regulator [gamma proteobacterium symbiont of Bathyaustriella thionipta]|nr:response regulator [gamma proteobacterium symbiont of Bathyaustriella thionipta]